MTGPEPLDLVGLFMAYPKHQLTKMLADHEADATGRCRTCRQGGDGSGRTVDCRLGTAARTAKRRLDSKRTGPPQSTLARGGEARPANTEPQDS